MDFNSYWCNLSYGGLNITMDELLSRSYAQLNHHLEWLKAQKAREKEEIEKGRKN